MDILYLPYSSHDRSCSSSVAFNSTSTKGTRDRPHGCDAWSAVVTHTTGAFVRMLCEIRTGRHSCTGDVHVARTAGPCRWIPSELARPFGKLRAGSGGHAYTTGLLPASNNLDPSAAGAFTCLAARGMFLIEVNPHIYITSKRSSFASAFQK
jgi:hypothetical protein